MEACVAKVVDTAFITEPSSSVSSVHRDDIRKRKEAATNGLVKESAAEQNAHSHAANGTINGHRRPEVAPCLYVACAVLSSCTGP